MEIPRSGYWTLALFWALSPGLSGPPPARADERERRITPPNHIANAPRHTSTVVHPVDEFDPEDDPSVADLNPEQRARLVRVVTMVLSEGFMNPPPDNPPPM